MNILKPLKAIKYQKAFELGLTLVGVENGLPVWLGENIDKYFAFLEERKSNYQRYSNEHFNFLKL